MGSIGSKLAQKPTENSTIDEKRSIPSTPILTPKVFRENLGKEALDPRSPSRHISRTPIELLSAAAHKLSNLVIESDKPPVETPLKSHLILGIDPRSPTFELQRTPIVVSASPDKKLPARIRNKNLDKVRNSTLLSSPQTVPPKLLDSNPVTPKIKFDVYKRKSLVLLETNIDFTETDLDTVIKAKYSGQSLQDLSKSLSEVTDPRSPSIDFLRTPIQICKNVGLSTDDLVNENLEEGENELVEIEEADIDVKEKANMVLSTDDLVSKNLEDKKELVEIEEDDIDVEEEANVETAVNIEAIQSVFCHSEDIEVANKNENNPKINATELGEAEVDVLTELAEDIPTTATVTIAAFQGNTEIPNGDNPEKENTSLTSCSPKILSLPNKKAITKSAPITPPSKMNSQTPKQSKSQPITPPFVNLTANMQEFDKKLTNLIYEDEDLIVCPRIVKPNKDQSRTPLAERNENRKAVHKLKVSDKPRKGEYTVNSKIPVFKDKKIRVQCENTPPTNMRAAKPKKPQWDAKDDTMVI